MPKEVIVASRIAVGRLAEKSPMGDLTGSRPDAARRHGASCGKGGKMKTEFLAIAIAAAATSASAQQARDKVSLFDSRFSLQQADEVSLFDSRFSLDPPPTRIVTVRVREEPPEIADTTGHFTATVKCDAKGWSGQSYVAVATTYLGAIKAAIAKTEKDLSDPVTGATGINCYSVDVRPKPEPMFAAPPNIARRVSAASSDDRRRGRVIHPGNRPRASR